MTTSYRTFEKAREAITARFKVHAQKVHTMKWQGTAIADRPDMVSYELLHESFKVPLFGNEDLQHWRYDLQPNLPWADDHFEERVCGAPLNPGTQWANWPWAASADKHRTKGEMFNHTYMERLWPRYAGMAGPWETAKAWFRDFLPFAPDRPHQGIRGEYGDLGTLVEMLAWEPDSRQGYIPLYFPEDTGLEGRKPCTLGYQLIMRHNRLDIYYPLRSCDFVRHWADDCYMAVRLLLWVLDECRKRNPKVWNEVQPGQYVMHCTSLHIFMNDWIALTGRK